MTAEDVTHGKPAPNCYRLGAERLGLDPADCLVLEDAPAGIAAGEAAGAAVLIVTATHEAPIASPWPKTRDFTRLRSSVAADGQVQLGAI